MMPSNSKGNRLYRMTLEVNTVWWWNLDSLCNIINENTLSKNYTKCKAWKPAPSPFLFCSKSFCAFKKLSSTFIGKWNIWNKLIILNMWYQNYLNMSKSLRFLFTEDSFKIRKDRELVLFRSFPFLVVYEPAKSHYQFRFKCIFCFIVRHLMTSRNLKLWRLNTIRKKRALEVK